MKELSEPSAWRMADSLLKLAGLPEAPPSLAGKMFLEKYGGAGRLMNEEERAPAADEEIEVSEPFASAWHALGDPEADLMVAKARLVVRLGDAIKAEGLTPAQAAERLGMAAPKLSRVLRGHFRSVTMDALWRMLRGTGVDVQVTAGLAAAPPAERG